MADSSWDNGGYAPPKKSGMPTWAKVLVGCGIVFLLLMATCIGGGIFLVKKGGDLIRSATAAQWTEMRADVEQLKTEDGARAFYAAHPGLAKSYPTEADFLAGWKDWSPKLESLPAEEPPLSSGRVSANMQNNNGRKTVSLAYQTLKQHSIEATWRDGALVDFQVR